MNAFKQKYQYSKTYKTGNILILISAGFAIAGGISLFIFGMAWLFMGVFKEPKNDSNVTWGTVMMVLGFYISLMNMMSLFLAANSRLRKDTSGLMLLAIISIAGVVSMIGGITILFTPVDNHHKKELDHQKPEEEIQTFERTLDRPKTV